MERKSKSARARTRRVFALCAALTLFFCATACGGQADISEYGTEAIAISGLLDEEFTVTPEELLALECVRRSATGATAKAGTVAAYGPLLNTFLAEYGKTAADFNRIRFIAKDEYRVVLREEYLTDYEVVLSAASGKNPLPEGERPLRILIP
ncbi:MAG: hypothetical protein LBT26_07055, partial [Clostridiales Family XIII bacterium]|nr:hypothetical protein [Clostridiales Family XIII bacterium]